MIEIPHRACGHTRRASIHSLEAVCCGVPPEVRVPSMAKGDELGRVGGADMIVKDAGRSAANRRRGHDREGRGAVGGIGNIGGIGG